MIFTQITVDTSKLLPEQAFLAETVRKRITERTVLSGNGAVLKITFRMDESLPEEHASISVSGDSADICGGRFRALVAGAGMLLRAIRYHEKEFGLESCCLSFTPEATLRQTYFARHFHNWYHMASNEEVARYVEDLALWGINSIHNLILPVINYDDDFETNPEALLCISNFKAIARIVKRLDMIMSACIFANQSFKNTPKEFYAVPNTDPLRGNNGVNVCPAKPGASEYLFSNARKILELVKDVPIDLFRFFPFDEGGCECEKCSPWGGRGYPQLIGKMKDVILEYFPEAKFIVATWVFHEDDWELFYKYMESHPWIDIVMADSHGEFPRFPLEHPLPHNTPLVTFPEISMWRRGPWGGYGANPLPGRFEHLFRTVQGHVSGFILYSEGLFEDINKIIVEEFYRDNSTTAGHTMHSYAAYELPGTDPSDFAELCRILEENHPIDSMGHFFAHAAPSEIGLFAERAHKALELARKMDSEILPSMRNCWRWRLFMLRAVIDFECFSQRSMKTPAVEAAFQELIDMYYAGKSADSYPDDPMHQCVRPPLY